MKKPSKNIIIIGPAHPLRGGLASYNERLAAEFISMGIQTSIYTFSLQYPSFLFPGTTQFSSEPPPAGLDIKVCINSISPLNWFHIGNKIKQLRPEIIVVRYWLPFMGPCLGTILRRARSNNYTRVVCIADNIIPHEKRIADHAFTRYFIKPVDAFITMSDKVLNDLRMFTAKPAQYVPHPLYDNFGEKISKQEARKHLAINDSDKIILFFGFIRRYKGLDILLDALSRLNGIKLLIAGEFYEDRKPYDDLIQQLSIGNQVIMHTSFIPDSEVKYYLCAADAVVQPYRNATQSGVTPLAYHFERPMIVTNVGGLPSLVPDNKAGLIAEPDAASLAEKIGLFFKLGEAHFLPGIRNEKIKYSWRVMADRVLDAAANQNNVTE